MLEHEYALLGGINRAKVGQYIGRVAAVVSALIVLLLLAAVDLAKHLGVSATIPPTVLSLVGAGMVFTALYWLFDKYIWRWPHLSRLLKIPNLTGAWKCKGISLDNKGQTLHEWEGNVTIVQSWDKIRVRLKTLKSGSNSITAALIYDEVEGYRLIYNYENDPDLTAPELNAHRGFADLMFSKDQRSAHGEYYNGHGRFTFGTMDLTRL